MAAYIFPPSPSTVRGKQLVVNLPLPSAQAYPEKTKETAKEKPPPANYSSSAGAMNEGVGRNSGGSSPLSTSSSAPSAFASSSLSSSRSQHSWSSHSDT